MTYHAAPSRATDDRYGDWLAPDPADLAIDDDSISDEAWDALMATPRIIPEPYVSAFYSNLYLTSSKTRKA